MKKILCLVVMIATAQSLSADDGKRKLDPNNPVHMTLAITAGVVLLPFWKVGQVVCRAVDSELNKSASNFFDIIAGYDEDSRH